MLGAGAIAERFAASVAASGTVSVGAIGARTLARARTLAERHGIATVHGGLAEVVTDRSIDAVYIGLPTHLHAEWALAAIAAGKHVLSEKPLAASLAETSGMIEAARRADVVILEGFPFQFTATTRDALGLLASDAIGRPRLVQCRMTYMRPSEAADASRDPRHRYGGGALSASGSYCVALAGLVFGGRPMRAQAHAVMTADGIDRDVFGLLDYGDDRTCQFAASFSLPSEDSAVIFGDAGAMILPIENLRPPDATTSLRVKRGTARGVPYELVVTAPSDGFREEAEFVAILAASSAERLRMMERSVDTATTLDALQSSLSLGGWVTVPKRGNG